MEKVYHNRPNFLGSEVGLVTKTITVPSSFATYVTENGRKIVKAGTIFTSPHYGLLFEDADITDGDVIRPLMIGGYYIDSRLPATASSYVSYFAASGLFPFVEEDATRPDFGTTGLTKLTAPSGSAVLGVITWSAITGALGYNIFNGNREFIKKVDSATYTATATGNYYIQAIGDNVNNYSSDLSDAVTVSALE